MSHVHSVEEIEHILQDLRDTEGTPETAQKIYKTWAAQYDQDVTFHDTYKTPRLVAMELARYAGASTNARILDLGAGTGLVASELAKLGFTNIDALDPNREMLEVAEQKGLYKTLICDYLSQRPLEIQSESYDYLVCSGTFVPNHANESCFEELIRLTKPDGLIIFTVHCSYTELLKKVDTRIEELQTSKHWVLLNPGDIRETVGTTSTNSSIKQKMFVLHKA